MILIYCAYHCKIRINEGKFERNKKILIPSKDNMTPNPLVAELIGKFMVVRAKVNERRYHIFLVLSGDYVPLVI